MGWAPAYGEDRRKDYSRAQQRARLLRKNETPNEKKLWKLLRVLNREGANFRRQANIGNRVFDFADLGMRVTNEELRANPGAVVERIRAVIACSSPQRGEGGEGGRTTRRSVSRSSSAFSALREAGTFDPARPLPLPPPPGAGEESGS